MKKLVFAALMLGGIAQATGCIITSDDDDDDTAQFEITWNLTAGDTDAAITCADASVASIGVISQLTGGQDWIDLYDCIDGYNATAPLPLGDFTVWVEALDAGDNMIAQSNSQVATLDVGGELVPLTYTFPVDGGFMALTWALWDYDTGDPETCTGVGSGGVGVLSTVVGSTDAFDDLFDCEDGEGITGKLPIDQYTVVVDILDTADPPGSLGQSQPRTVDIEYGNHLHDLGNFDFDFM